MRRGRTILIIVIVIVLLVIIGILALRFLGSRGGGSGATPTPGIRYVDIVTAGQNIQPGAQITDEMLSTMSIPETMLIAGEITDKNFVIGQFAKMQIAQSLPIMEAMISSTPGISTVPGSAWASQIPQGLTAVSIPISRLNLVAYGVRDNDFVNVIVTMLLVDVDASYQTALPNYTAAVIGAGALPESLPYLTVQVNSGGAASAQGRTELDPTLNSAIYIVPAEAQRPRMVTQMIMQNIQILHVGSFLLPEESVEESPAQAGTTPTPDTQVQKTNVIRPDIVTLMVTPQDAVVLTYLIHSGADITLTLRNPNDFDFKTTTDAATLQYLLSQYNIPVPAKLPYATQPRIDEMIPPILPNDAIILPAE